MTTQVTLAVLAAALAALPVGAAAQHHGGGGAHESGDHEQTACEPSGSAGAGHTPCGRGHEAVTQAAAASASRKGQARAGQVVAIAVTGEGFVPAQATVKVGRPVTLVVTRKTDRTCATEIVLKEYGISRPLPLDQAVEVTFTPKKAGPIRYACPMDMIAGTLAAE